MQGIKLLFVGKTDQGLVRQQVEEFRKRASRFIPVEVQEIPDVRGTKGMSEVEQKRLEGREIVAAIGANDEVILLDERGVAPTSVELSGMLSRKMMSVQRKLIFIVGGPYGFSDEVYALYSEKLSLSRLTLNHQMVRMFLAEQIYRAMAILHNHPYHHA